jgi:FlaA1/EpsC-like NDP-sugar epimerase
MISKAVQGVAVLGAAKHVKDKSKNKIKKRKRKQKIETKFFLTLI